MNIKNIIEKEEFVGSFETMKDIYKNIGIAASNNSNTLIIGDTGTGKDLVARLIHKNSNNSSEPFVAINCTTIPENLFEKLMYGKIENFSKNQNDPHMGYIQKVGKGTLYLDEIAELNPLLQVKLLRFLETKVFYPLGSSSEIKFQGRIICACSKKREELENSDFFRNDLYYRISEFEIQLPNLKDRKNDIKELILHFVKLHCKELKIKEKIINEDGILFLKDCDLKGNVRELKNIIYKTILNSRNETITVEDLKTNINSKENDKLEVFNKITENLLDIYGLENSNLILEDFEKYIIKAVFNKTNNISKVANYLGITRNTLKAKLKKYNL
jgi:DNA-binding NtrC family response regulator